MIEYNVVIVGAGPAGLALGYMLQRHGIRCLIIEKQSIIKSKACAGGTTKKMRDLSASIYNKHFEYEIDGVACKEIILADNKNKIKYPSEANIISIDREQLSLWAISNYVEIGGELWMDTRLLNINLTDKIISTNKCQIKYNFLVGADGICSRTRKILYESSYNVFSYLEYEDKVNSDVGADIQLRLHNKKPEYVWRRPGYTQYARWTTNPKKIAAPIGVGILPVKQNLDTELLIGAAGLLENPFMGEGLYTALLSAEHAFKHIRGTENYCTWIRTRRHLYKIYYVACYVARSKVSSVCLRFPKLCKCILDWEANKGFL